MPLILYECALHRFPRRPPNWTLLIKATFKSTSVPKQWLAYMTFFAIILLHLRTHSSKNYSLIFLHVSTLISSITSFMNTPPMMNQFIQSTPRFLLFILTIRLISPNNFYIFLIFYATPRFLPLPPGTKYTKKPPAENDRRPGGEPAGSTFQQNRRSWQAAPAVLDAQTRSKPRTAGPTATG